MESSKPDAKSQAGESNRGSAKAPKLYREGDYLVVPQRWVDLPAGCVVCGSPEAGRLRLKIRKASMVYVLFGLFGIVAYNSAPTARLRAGLCSLHRGAQGGSRLPTQLLIGGSIACVLGALILRTPFSIAVGLTGPLVLLQFAAMYAVVRPKLLTAKHADRVYIWLDGVHHTILSQAQEVAQANDGDRS